MTTNPWAAAAQQQTAPASTTPPASNGTEQTSSLGDAYDEVADSSSLFGATFESLPSLFGLEHAPGTKIRLTITVKPRDVQSTCHPSASPDRQSRLKQYWVTDPTSGKRKPGLEAVDPRTGKANDPVMNLVISGQTAERNPKIPGDDGRRSWFVSGSAKAPKGHVTGNPVLSSKRAVLDALQLAAESGLRITNDEQMIGKVIEVHRVEREQPGVSTSSWFWQARITVS